METILDYYSVSTPSELKFFHATNNLDRLYKALDLHADFVEFDVSYSNNSHVIAHPPITESDLDLEFLLHLTREKKVGLKLDFKHPLAVESSLKLLIKHEVNSPVILNADVLGLNGRKSSFHAKEFINACTKLYPKALLSLGWVTYREDSAYTQKDIDSMLKVTEKLQCTTFPIKASLLIKSWNELKGLLIKDNTLTIWKAEPVEQDLKDWMHENLDPQKTFLDLE